MRYGTILDDDTPKGVINTYAKRISDIYKDNDQIQKIYNDFINDRYYSDYETDYKSEAHRLWLFIYSVGSEIIPKKKTTLTTTGERYSYPSSEEPNNTFKIICNKVGINGFVDYYGKGWIHPNEPKQAVFFQTKKIGEINVYEENLTKTIIETNDKREMIIKNDNNEYFYLNKKLSREPITLSMFDKVYKNNFTSNNNIVATIRFKNEPYVTYLFKENGVDFNTKFKSVAFQKELNCFYTLNNEWFLDIKDNGDLLKINPKYTKDFPTIFNTINVKRGEALLGSNKYAVDLNTSEVYLNQTGQRITDFFI